MLCGAMLLSINEFMMLENQECCWLNLCGSIPNMGLRFSDKVQ